MKEARLGGQLAESSLEQRRSARDLAVLEQSRESVVPRPGPQELVGSIGREDKRAQRIGPGFG